MSDRLEALLGLEGPGIWQECERRVALDHRLCRPGRGVIKEGGRLKLDPRRLTRETTRQLGSPQIAAANESTHFTQVSFLSSPLVSVSGRRT